MKQNYLVSGRKQNALIQKVFSTEAKELAGEVIENADKKLDVNISKVRRMCGDNCRRFGNPNLKENFRCETSKKTVWSS